MGICFADSAYAESARSHLKGNLKVIMVIINNKSAALYDKSNKNVNPVCCNYRIITISTQGFKGITKRCGMSPRYKGKVSLELGKYIIKRILFLIPTLLLVSLFVYTIISAAPGDPAQLALGEGATAEAVAAKRVELGLDKPFIVQYLNWLKNVILHFDFGQSYGTGISVSYQIKAISNTLKLAAFQFIGSNHRRAVGNHCCSKAVFDI